MTPQEKLAALAQRAIPFLRDEGAKYDDDGSNEPLELARDIDQALSEHGEVVVTTDESGHCVAVTRQDSDGRILSVIWEASEHGGGGEVEPGAVDRALEIGWRAGVTCSANVCVQRSDNWNSQDADPHLIDEANDCSKAIARWLDPSGQTMDELRGMFHFNYVPTHTTPSTPTSGGEAASPDEAWTKWANSGAARGMGHPTYRMHFNAGYVAGFNARPTPSAPVVDVVANAAFTEFKGGQMVGETESMFWTRIARAALSGVSAPVGLGVVDELLTNIKRSCVRGRNAADPTPENSSFIATFDHIEDLAQQARRALSGSAPVGVEVELRTDDDGKQQLYRRGYNVRFATFAPGVMANERRAVAAALTPPADATNREWPGCSGDPASCPENEGYGCCKPNPAAAPRVEQECNRNCDCVGPCKMQGDQP